MVISWYQRGGTWYQKGVPVSSLYDSVPIIISSMDLLVFQEQMLAFNSGDNDNLRL